MPEGRCTLFRYRLRGRENRPEPVAVGTIIWLASELMFFAALFAAYFTIRNVTQLPSRSGQDSAALDDQPALINMPFAIINTSVLVAGSSPLPDGCVRRGAWQCAIRRTVQPSALGASGVVHADLPHGGVLHWWPGLRVRRPVP